jgi:hypothetical protein
MSGVGGIGLRWRFGSEHSSLDHMNRGAERAAVTERDLEELV